MCNPAYIIAAYKWYDQEQTLEDAREQSQGVAQVEVQAHTQRHGQALLSLSLRQQNDLRKAASAQGLAAVKMAGRGVTGGTAFTGAVQDYAMRTSELAGAYAIKQRQARAQYGGAIAGTRAQLDMRMSQYASTGWEGLMMNLATAAVTTYLATGDFGILSGAPAAAPATASGVGMGSVNLMAQTAVANAPALIAAQDIAAQAISGAASLVLPSAGAFPVSVSAPRTAIQHSTTFDGPIEVDGDLYVSDSTLQQSTYYNPYAVPY